MNNFSIVILILYLFTFFTSVIGRFLNITIANYFAKIISLATFIFAAFRPKEFPDLDTYEIIFNDALVGDFNNEIYWLTHGEPGFKIIIYLLHICGIDFEGFLLVMSLLSYALLIYISKISKIPFTYIWYTYFSFYFITRDLGIIRLSIASHLIVLMFLQRKYIWKILTLIFASLTFQYFAIIAIIAPFLSKIKLNITIISIILVVSYVLSNYINFESLTFLMPEKQMVSYDGTEQVTGGSSSSISALIRNLIFAFFIFLLFKNKSKNTFYNSWIWSAILSVSIYILTFNILIISQRFSAYFGAIIAIAFSHKMTKVNSTNMIFILILLFCLLNFIIVFYYNNFVWSPTSI
jgi:hypothetical protein